MPTSTKVKLPSGAEVNIVTHDFLEQLYSLLSDPDLMKDENLLFTDGNPFQAPSKDNWQAVFSVTSMMDPRTTIHFCTISKFLELKF